MFLVTFTALYGVMDLKDDLLELGGGQLLANVTGIPALFSAGLWA